MTIRATIVKIVHQEDLNFLLTNQIPRRLMTRFMGWFSRIEQPLIRDISMKVWRFFSDLDLSDARETRFRSMHHCFTRQLIDGARPIDMDPAVLVSPCDAVVGAFGTVEAGRIFQIKGFPYALSDLLDDEDHAETFRDGCYVTLRLTASMYHRFHAPYDCHVESVTHISGDTWNVNPIALRRVERLFCKNERAVLRTTLCGVEAAVTLVPVAAILVAGIRLRFLQQPLRRHENGRHTFSCNASLRKGQEMGWFEHGSTIIVFAPESFGPCDGVEVGMTIRVGQPLLKVKLPSPRPSKLD
jgi:phosphatidylserine decarboxylase